MYVSVTPEVAVESLTKFAGGLGVLEGDKLIEAKSMGIDYAVITMYHPRGYASYEASDGDLAEVSDDWVISDGRSLGSFTIRVRGEPVNVDPIMFEVSGSRLILLRVLEPHWAVELTKKLYVEKNAEEMFLKYLILSKGAATLIESGLLGDIDEIHLQESFAGMTAFALKDLSRVKFVTHSPGPWAHPVVHKEWLLSEFSLERLKDCVEDNYVNLTECVIKLVPKSYVVSRKQLKVMRNVIPSIAERLTDATNGVSLSRWCDKEVLNYVLRDSGDLGEFARIRQKLKEELIAYLRRAGFSKLPDLKTPVVTWVRRVVKYKRPYFITRFIEENKDLNAFYVLGGKPHPQDTYGKMYAREFLRLSRKYGNVVYVSNYGLEDARYLLRGSDLLLFTPFPGWEASGTSFMKAGVNGTPTLASRDGAVLEMIKDSYNGWLFGKDISEFIDIYTSVKASEVDEEEYEEFSKKLSKIIETYLNEPEKYLKISMNAAKTFVRLADVRNTLFRLISG
ncbi:MAG: glycogen/starch/alpha-glucan phosphorylase [Thermoprotei archaeon]